MLEANGKVNGIGEISHPPPQPLHQFGCRFKYITTSTQGVDVPNLIKIDSAVAALRMREKHDIAWGFFVKINPFYPFFATPTGRIFSAIVTLNGPYDVFLQPFVPFGGCVNIVPHLGGQIPQKPPFWGRE